MGVLKTAQTVNVRPFNFCECKAQAEREIGFLVCGREAGLELVLGLGGVAGWFFVLVKKFSRFISCRQKSEKKRKI